MKRPMGRPLRPALAGVLEALTGKEAFLWRAAESIDVLRVGAEGASMGETFPWVTDDPREAIECLQARDLVPMDYAGRFTCASCVGFGSRTISVSSRRSDSGEAERRHVACDRCGASGSLAHPNSVADVVAWSSLGAAAVAMAEALGHEAYYAMPKVLRTDPPVGVRWCVGTNTDPNDIVECCGSKILTVRGLLTWPVRRERRAKSRHEVAAVAAVWESGLSLVSVNGMVGLVVAPLTDPARSE